VEVVVKYWVTWTTREGGSPQEREQAMQRTLDVFAKWEPGPDVQIQQLLSGLDARSGLCVLETDDPHTIVRTTALFAPFFNYTVTPALDVQEVADEIRGAVDRRGN
jgi:hypothetical protein